MRRHSPEFRKGLRKEQKKIKQAADAAAKEQEVRDARELALALVELELEAMPATPEQREVYFQEHVATAEALAAQGPAQYVKAATHFYRALRVYPQPVELLMIYQKVCPEPVFQLVLKLTQLTSAVNAGAAAGGVAAPAAAPASVADIDDSAPAADAEAEAEEEAAEEEAEEVASEGAPSANSSGAEWERVSNNA
ncbi:hypothetical protein VHUM_00211 [Vanrija humicola]|uniref:Uncharacterized protein n=1 Tax=Vanrija humicola TaxID=5417 RepID=A0A7D8V5W0_VANHU|nr:hypothetical protein VHUM_00211 [Vanrija humicola]